MYLFIALEGIKSGVSGFLIAEDIRSTEPDFSGCLSKFRVTKHFRKSTHFICFLSLGKDSCVYSILQLVGTLKTDIIKNIEQDSFFISLVSCSLSSEFMKTLCVLEIHTK